MHIVVLMDPPETVIADEDTSFALMREAQSRSHQVDYLPLAGLSLEEGTLWGRVCAAHCEPSQTPPLQLAPPRRIALSEVDLVLVRKDPPFDSDYLWATLLLESLRGVTLVVNDPRGLREANEKLYATHFSSLMPETLVSANADQIRAFVARVGGRAVLKPLSGAGGQGVFSLFDGDLNFNAVVETLTSGGSQLAMCQRYLPEIQEGGDKRILLLDGEPLGAILRLPQAGDLRSNIHVGGRVVATELDEADRHIVATVAPRLRQDGLCFVGLDVIGGKLTEVNVTSPTGIQQMSRLSGEKLEARVLAYFESLCAR